MIAYARVPTMLNWRSSKRQEVRVKGRLFLTDFSWGPFGRNDAWPLLPLVRARSPPGLLPSKKNLLSYRSPELLDRPLVVWSDEYLDLLFNPLNFVLSQALTRKSKDSDLFFAQ